MLNNIRVRRNSVIKMIHNIEEKSKRRRVSIQLNLNSFRSVWFYPLNNNKNIMK
jgi:hypothetical protein